MTAGIPVASTASGPRVSGHVLLAEDEAPLAALLSQHLTALGYRVTNVSDGAAALRMLRTEPFDLALLDIIMPPPDGLEVLRALANDPDPPPVIITTGIATIDSAVQAMRLGAYAYIAKPYRMAELGVVIARALESRVLAHENTALRAQLARAAGTAELLTQFAPLRAVHAMAVAAAAGDAPILIVGPPGAGKCALARVLHGRSGRAARPFVTLDAGMLARDDAERILFGSEAAPAGAAVPAALAQRGTLYLGDVLALAPRLQARVGRALRDGRFRSVGAPEDRHVRARVIAATREPLSAADPRANADLLSAFSVVTIVLPPLTERAVDIPLLADAFLTSGGDGAAVRFDPDAMTALEQYSWPGNVAELRAVIERARLIARGGIIRVTDLALSGADDGMELAAVERRHIASVLEANQWHQGRAAQSLGISPKTLYRKIREFGLQRPSSR